MEVKQPDGQLQQATISKLTDQSTYTVGEWEMSDGVRIVVFEHLSLCSI